jgi:hypothetical protein
MLLTPSIRCIAPGNVEISATTKSRLPATKFSFSFFLKNLKNLAWIDLKFVLQFLRCSLAAAVQDDSYRDVHDTYHDEQC